MDYVRLLCYLALGFHCATASAAITCSQLAEIAFATQKLRDQGYSLTTVLSEAAKLESTNKFTAVELDNIKVVVEQAYKGGSRLPLEMLQSCKNK